MPKLNDLTSDKDEVVDESTIFTPSPSRPLFGLVKKSTQDLAYLLLKYIDMSGQKDVKVAKNKTKHFDALSVFKRNRDISLQKKGNFIMRFFTDSPYFKTFPGKMSLLGGIFIICLFSYIFLSKAYIEQKVNDGFSKIVALKQGEIKLTQVEKSISDARLDFIIAHYLFLPYKLVYTQDIRNASHIITAGKNITDSLLDFISIYNESERFISKKGLTDVMYSQLIANLKPYLLESQDNIEATIESLEKIHDLGNKQIEEKIVEQTVLLKKSDEILSSVNTHFETLLELLGHSKEKRYLVIFQNADEIRATGGFMGSMGILKVFRGQVKSFESKDVYAYEWNLKSSDHERLPPPEGINKLTDTFGLRDANYFVNVAESSKNIKFFVENAGYEIDGIIYLNQNILLEFLDLLGGVEFEKIGEKITRDNFSQIISLLVEAKKYKEGTLGTPKQILFDFMEVFYKKLKDKKLYSDYISIIGKNIFSRDIIIYSFNREEQELISELQLSGDVDYTKTFDFSYPVFTSIGGNKSDRYIKREYQKVVRINTDCSIETSLKIIQKHTFNKANENVLNAYIKKYELPNVAESLRIQGKSVNKQYVRVLIPKEAIVETTADIFIEQFKNAQGVNFYMDTEPKQVNGFQIQYKLPNTDCKKYDYALYKQPGIESYSVYLYDGKKTSQRIGIQEDFFYNVSN